MGSANLKILLVTLLLALPIRGHQLSGKVQAVFSGDLLVLADAKEKLHLISIKAIRAPKAGQDFFKGSLNSLEESCLGKTVNVQWFEYGPTCQEFRGKRLCSKKGKVLKSYDDLGLIQVRRGLAKYYSPAASDLSTADRALYRDAEAEAKKKKRGMWKPELKPASKSASKKAAKPKK